MMFLGGTGTLGRVDRFDVFSLGQGSLVTAETTLGKFINALVGRRSARLDHVENASFVGTQADDFTDNAADELGGFG